MKDKKPTTRVSALRDVSTEVLIKEATTRPDFADAVGHLGGRALVFDARPAEWHVAIPMTKAVAARTPTGS